MWLLQQSHQTSVIKVSQLVQAIKAVRIALVSFLRFAQAQPIFNLPRTAKSNVAIARQT